MVPISINLRSVAKNERDHKGQHELARIIESAADEIDRLRHPFRNADALDWEHLFKMLPDSGHGRFWKEVLTEAKAAMAART